MNLLSPLLLLVITQLEHCEEEDDQVGVHYVARLAALRPPGGSEAALHEDGCGLGADLLHVPGLQ